MFQNCSLFSAVQIVSLLVNISQLLLTDSSLPFYKWDCCLVVSVKSMHVANMGCCFLGGAEAY